ncbi:hypothetical protein BCR32DRAFT_296006 [Anaeromyces robustus]|jgi:hypothetical protein|uniref:RlpA-like protein double-psi beta-barrel domain-containing protein n=1 Tax=Anaeromyces robustus TaxID=1754192 RepID=A0A1Y1WTM8_9FUNG|nr:hypothetical protein BCR32DRAFT_296006 [Anaeromyces robustus]|eukprot:ORX76802.1 hypothetical protein BCR32DRAFT_296006 [Anaeromyces robustus]
MKLFNLFVFAIGLVASAFAANDYQITYYGCPKECNTQKKPSCHLPTYPLEHDGTKFFCALSTDFPHYKDYCGQRVVVMLTDGTKNMINVQVVDSCSSCPKYHVDLSSYSFPHLLKASKGEADCIWGVFDKKGKKLAGPIYKSVSSAAKKLGMSKDGFINAFIANASKLAKSGEHVGTFNKIVKSATTTRRIIATTKKVTPIKSIPIRTTTATVKLLTTTKILGQTKTTTIKNSITTTKIVAKPTTSSTIIEDEVGEVKGVDAKVGVYCVGGVAVAAGLGLVLMKKKSPSTYEDMKQKFPDAFSHIKRGVSRSATSIKRRVTTKRSNENTTVAPLASVTAM